MKYCLVFYSDFAVYIIKDNLLQYMHSCAYVNVNECLFFGTKSFCCYRLYSENVFLFFGSFRTHVKSEVVRNHVIR